MNKTPTITTSAAKIFAGLSLVLGMAATSHAQGINADAQLSSQAVGDGTFNYTITLHNEASSSQSINTFWFAWIPNPSNPYGYDLLSSMPTGVTGPSGWFSFATSGSFYDSYPDGWSIEAYNYSGPAAVPGSTLTFTFNSVDSPADIAGTSHFLPISTSTSYLYSGILAGNTDQFVVQGAPEPSTLGLLLLGSVGVLVVGGWRKLRQV